jgi:hypothetical protein
MAAADGTSVDDSRLVRAAQNQTLFREVNERVKDLDERLAWQLDRGDWLCECEDETCFERIRMALPEYERLRAHGNRFAVKPGHEAPELEDIIERHDGYLIVAKRGAGGVYATEHDPRSQTSA